MILVMLLAPTRADEVLTSTYHPVDSSSYHPQGRRSYQTIFHQNARTPQPFMLAQWSPTAAPSVGAAVADHWPTMIHVGAEVADH